MFFKNTYAPDFEDVILHTRKAIAVCYGNPVEGNKPQPTPQLLKDFEEFSEALFITHCVSIFVLDCLKKRARGEPEDGMIEIQRGPTSAWP